MSRIAGDQSLDTARRSRRKAALASVIGTTVEWYDYFIFGIAAAVVFDEYFFPDLSPAVGTLASFATFGVGFLARPLGSVVFAHYGDRVGRKPVMVMSLLVMGVATVAIGLLPGYATIGIWAPVLLVVFRMVQGFGVGGEWGGAALIATEHAPKRSRGLYGTAPMVGVPLGTMLSSGVFSLVSTVCTEEQFAEWGWRVPFLLSGVLIVIGLVIRSMVEEPAVFTKLRRSSTAPVKLPVLELLRHHWRVVLLAAGVLVSGQATFYVTGTWMVAYATGGPGFDRVTVLNAIAVVAAIGVVMKIASGWLSDRYGRRPLIMVGALFLLLTAFPYFWLINSGVVLLLGVAVLLAELGRSLISGPIAALYSELFETRIRYSGSSVSYQLASIVGGGFAPAISAALLLWAGSYWSIAVYLMALNLVALLSVLLTRETARSDLEAPAVWTSPRAGVDGGRVEP